MMRLFLWMRFCAAGTGARSQGRRLLEWETAAEAELGDSASARRWMCTWSCTPVIALAIAAVLLLVRPSAFWVALPILVLWACGKAVSVWLDRPPHQVRSSVAAADESFLRLAALRTWRYFAEFSGSQHHWLVPDNVQEEPAKIAARVSPTNLGFLLNARQIACRLGYLTVPEFAEQTLRSFEKHEANCGAIADISSTGMTREHYARASSFRLQR